MHALALSALLVAAPGGARETSSPLSPPDSGYELALYAELGFLGVITHHIRQGKNGTWFDYVDDGGQDVLFPFARLSARVTFAERHGVTLLYQPIDLRTSELLESAILVDELTFPADTPLDLRYGFSFWRASYAYDLIASRENELALGGGLQLRNATIDFTSADGSLRRVTRDVGPVPLLEIRGRKALGGGYWLGGEADGIYAPIRYLNGGDSDVEGAILDASLRAGIDLDWGISLFLNARYLGGGASGTSEGDDERGDGYSSNWLHLFTASLGFSLR